MPAPPAYADHPAHARALIRAILDAADPGAAVDRAWPDPEPPPGGRIALLAAGKAALPMARAAAGRLPRIDDALVIAPPDPGAGELATAFPVLPADHPVPSARNVLAAGRASDLAARLDARDLLVLCLSGGASAHLTLPAPGLTLEDVALITRELNRAGAAIAELNTVRKHVERLKGGRLAARAHPAKVVALILSDVVGDPLDVIASGPVSPDPTTAQDALGVLERYRLEDARPAITHHLRQIARSGTTDTPPPGSVCFERVETHVVANHETALDAAIGAVERLAFRLARRTPRLTGPSADSARSMVARAAPLIRRAREPLAWCAAGETTVDASTAPGTGGPAQEFALAGAIEIEPLPRTALVAFATDGVDGPTDAAGAVVTSETARRMRALGVDPARSLARHDSHTPLERAGALLRTGSTGTNVNDVMLLLAYAR